MAKKNKLAIVKLQSSIDFSNQIITQLQATVQGLTEEIQRLLRGNDLQRQANTNFTQDLARLEAKIDHVEKDVKGITRPEHYVGKAATKIFETFVLVLITMAATAVGTLFLTR